jgi:hypothetical protein
MNTNKINNKLKKQQGAYLRLLADYHKTKKEVAECLKENKRTGDLICCWLDSEALCCNNCIKNTIPKILNQIYQLEQKQIHKSLGMPSIEELND